MLRPDGSTETRCRRSVCKVTRGATPSSRRSTKPSSGNIGCNAFDEELWFLRRGVPSLVPDRVTRDPERVWRRALPALVALYAAMLLRGLVVKDQGVAVDVAIGSGVLVATWLISNLVHRQRLLSLPRGLGRFELASFVVGPAIPAIFTTETSDVSLMTDSPVLRIGGAAFVMIVQVGILVLVWFSVSFGLVSLTVWLLREMAETLGTTGAALARTLPLLLGVVTFFFLTAEVWQSVGLLHWFPYALLVLLFTALGGVFIARGRSLDIVGLATFESREELESVLEAGGVPPSAGGRPLGDLSYPVACGLDRRQRANLVAVAVLSRLVVATVVAVTVGLFFVVFGFLTVNADVVKAWTLQAPREIVSLDVPTRKLMLSWEHLNVAGFLATFSGFYFTIVSATDPTLRSGLRDTAEDGVRAACAARIALSDHDIAI
jgi:hypothetical protein